MAGNRCALVVVATETMGGRWSSEAVDFVSSLAGARARDAPGLRSWLGVAVGRGCSQCLVAWRLPWWASVRLACVSSEFVCF